MTTTTNVTTIRNNNSLINRTIIINDHNNIPQRFIIEDEPRPNLLEVLLESDKTIITHISTSDVYERNGDPINLYCDKSVSLKHSDTRVARTGLGLTLSVS
jgi:glucuronate isomerase